MLKLRAGDTFEVSHDTLSKSAIGEINSLLQSWVPLQVQQNETPPWDDGWDAVSKRGKLPKRISAYVYKRYGVSMTSEYLEAIGNYASNLVIKAGTRIVVTDKFDWNPGDYGDERSCFFRSKRKTWPLLHHMGARVGKIYCPDAEPGRCLIVDHEGRPFIFNFYGVASPHIGAQIWEAATGHLTYRVSLYAYGSTEHPLYINKGKAWTLTDGEALNFSLVNLDNQYIRDEIHSSNIYCENCYKLVADAPVVVPASTESKPISYLCHDCHKELQWSDELRWKMAELVPVPPAPKKKKKKTIEQQMEEAFYYGNVDWADVELGQATQRIISGAFAGDVQATIAWTDNAIRLTQLESQISAVIDRLIDERNACSCAACQWSYRNWLRQHINASPTMPWDQYLLYGLFSMPRSPAYELFNQEDVDPL